MIKLYTGMGGDKHPNGKWYWDNATRNVYFHSYEDSDQAEDTKNINGYIFKTTMTRLEEAVFGQEFQRKDNTDDPHVVRLEDIKNLALFLAPKSCMSKNVVTFMHSITGDRFLKALVIYFEYFLKVVEFVLIRRDETQLGTAAIQSEESNELRRIFSCRLVEYRLLLAREYSHIILGRGNMKPYHHVVPLTHISLTSKDMNFHESILAIGTYVVWVAMHRRAWPVIDMEMNRLFRSEHFKLCRYPKLKFSRIEEDTLYGPAYWRMNFRAQASPLAQELQKISPENVPLLWIGERKYRGTDIYLMRLELEYLVPDSQLMLIGVTHGILGHPKAFYNTILEMQWDVVRDQEFSDLYDPYHIVTQPYLVIPPLDYRKVRRLSEEFEQYYEVKINRDDQEGLIEKWIARDQILIKYSEGETIKNVIIRAEQEIADHNYGPSAKEIIKNFLEEKARKQKEEEENCTPRL